MVEGFEIYNFFYLTGNINTGFSGSQVKKRSINDVVSLYLILQFVKISSQFHSYLFRAVSLG